MAIMVKWLTWWTPADYNRASVSCFGSSKNLVNKNRCCCAVVLSKISIFRWISILKYLNGTNTNFPKYRYTDPSRAVTFTSLQRRVDKHHTWPQCLSRVSSHSLWLNSKSEVNIKIASAAPPQPALVDKEHSRSAIWKYFGYEANEHGKPKDTSKPICKSCYRAVLTKGANTSNIDCFNGNNINKRYCTCACLWP